MNLDACTPGQRDSILHVDGPLLVSAGAGSGKTFTLTQRIAYALLPESGPAVGGIDEVLAITFTEKAASEIKARVKRTLRAEGLGEEALKVDGAWISTIHGMCARILRAHALDLGIDPAFGIVGDAERADLLAAAIDGALGADNDIVGRGSFAALFDAYPARSSMSQEASVASMLQALLDKAAGLRGGLDAVDFGPGAARASSLARELLVAYEEVRPWVERAKRSAASEKALAGADEALAALRAYLDAHGAAREGAAGEAEALRELACVVDGCAFLPRTFGDAAVKAEVGIFQGVYEHVARQIALATALPLAGELMALAREVAARYEQAKGRLGKLDNDDLLSKTLAAFEEHPGIARRYEDRFKLVMVDEFQDTSQLQIDMIARLAGPRFSHLCTVGDAQQSIYRFRGADVNVYEAHKRVMRSAEVGALYVELTRNFRSHADVLSFVDRVFEQPGVFGESFMSLAPNPGRVSRYRGLAPRIDVVLAMQPAGRGTGVGAADAKRTAAREVARRFARLREEGHSPGEMVVLLGRMGRAEVYAEALRAEGFECVVAGGSQFASAPEVRVIARLLEAVANPANTAALFEVLASDMVRLSADDFLELATEKDPDTGLLVRRDLDKGFSRLAALDEGPGPRLAHAARLFERAWRLVRTEPLSAVAADVVARSGWMARLEGEGAAGTARAANVLKALRIVEGIEGERREGPASTARAFSDALAAGLKEAPGALSGSGGDVVRIMTIHASKGLEFPIVALADFADARPRSEKLLVEACGPVAYASLEPGAAFSGEFPNLGKRAKTPAADEADEGADLAAARVLLRSCAPGATAGCSQAAYRASLAERRCEEELAEARRKLYVGLTRASEALVVAMDGKEAAAGKAPSYPPLVDDIRSALCGTSDFPEGAALLPYGGSEPARFERVPVVAPDGDGDAAPDKAPPASFLVPRLRDAAPARGPWAGGGRDAFSYSSLAAATWRAAALPEQDAADGSFSLEPPAALADEGRAPAPDLPEARADADRATALGSAFHRAAQFAVETGTVPDAARLDAFASFHGLTAGQRARLGAACGRWFASDAWAEALSWPVRRAEMPFAVRVGLQLMEGEMDLVCTDGEGAAGRAGRALVVDYKTGGADGESEQAVRERHLLQAQCYACALLSQGFEEVELLFARVEREAPSGGGPHTVRYRFASGDLEALKGAILSKRG